MPIGADLVLHDKENADGIKLDGVLLGKVIEETARKYKTPLAIPLMDLMLEKATLLAMFQIPEENIPTYHFSAVPDHAVEIVESHINDSYDRRLQANVDAVQYIAEQTDLMPVAMAIGPFSLMTKLLADPISPVYMASTGIAAVEDKDVALAETALEMSIRVILRSISSQLDAGAKAVMIAEPAANRVFISPKQLQKGSDIFDRYVMKYNRQIQALCKEREADMLFHCCGELTDYMVEQFTTLDPALLSLGSSRVLWEDAALVPETTVLYGNLPSKSFYSDDVITLEDVEKKACELINRMKAVGHPFILGSECDVLSVEGCHDKIANKVDAFCNCGC
jgi:uroporphyrinogen-III decarboxylase